MRVWFVIASGIPFMGKREISPEDETERLQNGENENGSVHEQRRNAPEKKPDSSRVIWSSNSDVMLSATGKHDFMFCDGQTIAPFGKVTPGCSGNCVSFFNINQSAAALNERTTGTQVDTQSGTRDLELLIIA